MEPTVVQNVMVFSVVTNVCDAQKSVRKIGLKLNTRKVMSAKNTESAVTHELSKSK